MSKKIISGRFLSSLGENNLKIGEPPSLHYGGSTSILTARTRNVLSWCYDNAPLHYMHTRFAMGISLRGGCIIGVDGNEFSLNPDEGILIFPFQTHYITPREPGNMINFSTTFFLQDASDNSLNPLKDNVFKVSDKDIDILKEMITISKNGSDGAKSSEIAHLLEWFLCRKLNEKTLKVATTSFNICEDEDSKYSQIVKYIKNNLSAPITAKDISDGVNISVPHLRRIFNKRTGGLNIGRFILILRIKQAYEMLMHSNLNIEGIGQKCGFSDQFVFSRAFKRIAGISPSKYRKEHNTKQ